jgi:integrase
MRAHKPEDVAAGRITLRAAYDQMVEHAESEGHDYAPNTLSLHEEAWKHLDGLTSKDVGKIKPAMVDIALRGIEGVSMRDKARKMLSTVFAFAIAERYVSESPVRPRRKPTTRKGKQRQRQESGKDLRYLSEDELARLVAEMPERYRALVKVMAYVGLRPGEAVSLRVGNLDPLGATLTVETALYGDTKTGEPRTIVLPRPVVAMLVDHIATYVTPIGGSFMFPREDGTPIDSRDRYNAWVRLFRRAAARADVNHGLSPNDLRHMAAARAIGIGADVYAVQRMLGHAKASITLDTYGSLWEARSREIADRLGEAIQAESA